jgi:hypothetical protein
MDLRGHRGPNNGRDARAIADLATRVVLDSGFEPAISLTMLTGCAMACIICSLAEEGYHS